MARDTYHHPIDPMEINWAKQPLEWRGGAVQVRWVQAQETYMDAKHQKIYAKKGDIAVLDDAGMIVQTMRPEVAAKHLLLRGLPEDKENAMPVTAIRRPQEVRVFYVRQHLEMPNPFTRGHEPVLLFPGDTIEKQFLGPAIARSAAWVKDRAISEEQGRADLKLFTPSLAR